MEIGAAIFFTDYSMAPTDLAVALEERAFDSSWVAEHSHIPATRRFSHPQGEAALTKEYFDVMDPFVTLSAAAAVYETRTLKMREQIEPMKEIWTKDKSEYYGEIVDFPRMMTRPKPVQKPHPPVIVGGAFRLAARRALRYGDGILPAAPSAGSGSPEEFMPACRRLAEEAGRDPRSLSVTLGGAPEDLAVLRRNRDLGVTRMNVRLPPAKEDTILPILDRWAKLVPQVRADLQQA